MTLNEFETKYQAYKSHDKIAISCDGCQKEFTPLKTRAKQTIKKRGFYFCPSCGQINRHKIKPMSEDVKNKISEGVKKYIRKIYD